MYTTEEAIEFGLLKIKLDRAVSKTDSSVPDSLGDKLFCMLLRLAYSFTYNPKEQVQAEMKMAKELLQEYENMVY